MEGCRCWFIRQWLVGDLFILSTRLNFSLLSNIILHLSAWKIFATRRKYDISVKLHSIIRFSFWFHFAALPRLVTTDCFCVFTVLLFLLFDTSVITQTLDQVKLTRALLGRNVRNFFSTLYAVLYIIHLRNKIPFLSVKI